MKRAIEFIEKNLLTPFSLDDVAAAEGLSTYHLHRVFAATFGRSIKTYVRKRRLTEAARLLRTTTRGVLDIALECQFESQASFTRAFRALFNQPPASFRREGPAHGRLHLGHVAARERLQQVSAARLRALLAAGNRVGRRRNSAVGFRRLKVRTRRPAA
ncbi:MAG: hypothetical protein DI536_01265 [Archangium gephyra]|uniref:HTH araC/xylS-type domain-containing protein n=1 Tax=Archangium gephyra TaxID=48 RepID=A0A2W5TWN6_9BACT|nr:MAG: hypothetical protein DI536_01265 [Archangium gephyra]